MFSLYLREKTDVMTKFEPVIKWSGSKRSQAEEILKYFPDSVETYYEPFCGGASMMRALMESGKDVKRYVISDINDGLIELWKTVCSDPKAVAGRYGELWNELNKDNDLDRKRDYYNMVRDRYNREKDPLDFMFIMRTATNGMPRYNLNGEFNTSLHITRNGMLPERLRKVVFEWNGLLKSNDVEFICCDYRTHTPNENDFMYLDPPYANTKGMYYGALDNEELFGYLRGLRCHYAMSFDGISGKEDNTFAVPEDVYDKHVYIRSGNSSFKRVVGISNDSIVYESLYVR